MLAGMIGVRWNDMTSAAGALQKKNLSAMVVDKHYSSRKLRTSSCGWYATINNDEAQGFA